MLSNTLSAAAIGLLSTLIAPVDAYWRMSCPGTLIEGRLDPIVSPGKVAGHAHVVLGGNGFAPSMDYNSTQKSTCTSCTIKGDMSNYWSPKLYYAHQDGKGFESVAVSGGTVYYQQRASYPGKKLMAFPPGFRMLAGDPFLRTYSDVPEQKAVSHVCLNYAGGAPPEGPALPKVNCPNGVRSQVYFPSCWDGVNLDSPDHKSHMAYPSGVNSGTCPDSHPQPLISIFYEFMFDTGKFASRWYGNEQPFVFAMGDKTGYGFHGDFVNGWDQEILQNGIDKKTTEDFGDVGDVTYDGIFEYPEMYGSNCALPPLVPEPVNGVLDKLPGCNPVTNSPVKGATGCTASTTLSVQTSDIYTDVTKTLNWSYHGCGVDEYGNNALPTQVADSQTMTVETCIKACEGKGYSIAGLEYASQCFCGNTLPARAEPTPGVVGSCNKACTGNSTEWCGDANRLSLYKKCTGSDCKNADFGLIGDTGSGSGSGSGGYSMSPVPTPTVSPPAGSSSTAGAGAGAGGASGYPTAAPPASSTAAAGSQGGYSMSPPAGPHHSTVPAGPNPTGEAPPPASLPGAAEPSSIWSMIPIPSASASFYSPHGASSTGGAACGGGPATVTVTLPAATVTVTAGAGPGAGSPSSAPAASYSISEGAGAGSASSTGPVAPPPTISPAPYSMTNGTNPHHHHTKTHTHASSGFLTYATPSGYTRGPRPTPMRR